MSRKRTVDSDDSHLVWEDLGSEMLYETPIFSLRTVHRRSRDGRNAPFISVSAPDWVTVIAEMPGDGISPHFLIVRQYRHGTERVGLEFPAGVIDAGEDAAAAAARELREETGYEAAEWTEIGAVSPNPAFMANTAYTYLARRLRKITDVLELDEHELLDVHSESYDSLQSRMGRPPYDSAITVQAWHFYLKAVGRI